jgi:PAS domain S-box-containing protein
MKLYSEYNVARMKEIINAYTSFRSRVIELLYNSNYYERYERSSNLRFSLVLFFVLTISLLKILLSYYFGYTGLIYNLYFIAIIVSVWYAGTTAGVLAVLISLLMANYLFIEPLFTISFGEDHIFAESVVFIVEGLLMVWLIDIVQSVIHISKLREHRQAEAELRFTRLADNAPAVIWRTDRDHNIIYWNNLFKEYIPFDLLEVGPIVKIFESIIPQKDDGAITEIRRSLTRQEPFQVEMRMRNGDGRYDWILMRSEPFVSPTGIFNGYVGSGINITERKLLEKRKSQFISITSHELKTPLTSIKAFMQLLSRMDSLKKQKDVVYYFTKVVKQVDLMTVFINDLLDLSRIERGSFYVNKEPFSLSELISNTARDFYATHRSHRFKVIKMPNIMVMGDRNRLTQVLVNFLENAVKYAPEKSVIEIGTQLFKGTVRVYVKDQGLGIALKDQKKIFKLFVQSGGELDVAAGGLGLGLYIAKMIIDKHGGNIWVQSTLGRGSTFYFSLPLK